MDKLKIIKRKNSAPENRNMDSSSLIILAMIKACYDFQMQAG